MSARALTALASSSPVAKSRAARIRESSKFLIIARFRMVQVARAIGFFAPDHPMSALGNGFGPLTNTVRQQWAGSVLRRPDESVVHAVRADVIPDNDAVVINRSHFRCQGAGRVNRGE